MTVLFLHIPKAAGTSYLNALFEAIEGPSFVANIPGEVTSEEFQQQVDPEWLRQFAFVAGHVDYGLCRRAPFLRPVTVLRDPIDRIVSWYHYVLRSEDRGLAPWRHFIEERRLSVEAFLLHPQLRWLQGQAQTMQVAGYLWSGEPLPLVDTIVREAEANLAQFAHVGIYERLGDSLRLAQAELGLEQVPTLPDRNVSPRAADLDPDVRSEVAGMIGMDAAFYPSAVANFEQRLAAHGLDGHETVLAPPHRPAPVAPAFAPRDPVTPPPPATAPATERGVGDWIELAWSPEPGTNIGGALDWPVPLSAPVEPPTAMTGSPGDTFVVSDDAPVGCGANWVGVQSGLYQVQATVPCRRFGEAQVDTEWDLLFDFAWYDTPPIPFVEGLPGAPDLVLWIPQRVPVDLPKLPLRGAPISGGGLLQVPTGGGHLCALLGSTQPVTISPGDQVRVRYVKVG